MTTIPALQSTTQVHIPGVGTRDAECLAGGFVFNCRVPSHEPLPKFTNAYKSTKGVAITSVMVGQDGWVRHIDISPSQRNAAIVQWWLDNCFPTIKKVLENITDAEEDIANAFGWWLSSDMKFIQVPGWERNIWRGIALDILNKVTKNKITFRQAAGIDKIPRPHLHCSSPDIPTPELPPPLSRATVDS